MIQGTAVYTVRVRDANGGYLPLGDIGGGADFATWLAACMRGFESVSPDQAASVSCAEPVVEGDDTFLVLEHCQSGVAADIVDTSGRLKMRLSPDDMQRTKHAALFRLFHLDATGYLATQVSNVNDVETLLEEGIRARLRTDFPGRALEIWPFLSGLVFRKAIEEEALKSARLVRYEQPADRAIAAVQRLVKTGTVGKLTPGLAMFGLVKRARDLLPGQAARDEARASGEIVEFRGGIIPQRLEVEQGDGTRRSFVVRRPGPAFTEETAFLPAGEAAATDASLLAELRRALRDVNS